MLGNIKVGDRLMVNHAGARHSVHVTKVTRLLKGCVACDDGRKYRRSNGSMVEANPWHPCYAEPMTPALETKALRSASFTAIKTDIANALNKLGTVQRIGGDSADVETLRKAADAMATAVALLEKEEKRLKSFFEKDVNQ
jgi:hypothetical protein